MIFKHPKVSVITPTKNRLTLLGEAMDSVAAQTLEEWEHIIVDDGSDDGSIEMVEARLACDSRVRLIKREIENTGANVCRNLGLSNARGDYILFLDSDDLLEPRCLAQRSALLDRNADVDFVTFQTGIFIDRIGDQGDLMHDCELMGDDLTRFLLFETPWIITGPLWRRCSLERVGPFDESLLSWQDLELHIRALTYGVRYLRFAEVDHHVRWKNEVGRISAEQRKSPRHLAAAPAIFEKFEQLVRQGPGMTWARQRALCSLYFFIAEKWIEAGEAKAAGRTWRLVRERNLSGPLLYASGLALLRMKSWRLPESERVINKWKGWMRLRTNAEMVSP